MSDRLTVVEVVVWSPRGWVTAGSPHTRHSRYLDEHCTVCRVLRRGGTVLGMEKRGAREPRTGASPSPQARRTSVEASHREAEDTAPRLPRSRMAARLRVSYPATTDVTYEIYRPEAER